MRKIFIIPILASATYLSGVTSTMTHRAMGTSPLLYKMIDYSKHQWSFETEPIYSSIWNENQVISNIILNGKQTLIFDQQGTGDLNPVWLNLMANTTAADYTSKVTFTPSFSQSGMLFHWYDQFDKVFVDIRTALVQTKSEIAISEIGGGNGLNEGITNAQQAFTQSSWNYGKIGGPNHVVGLDNIELRFGGVTKATSNASTYSLFITGFGILEAPTGTGTKAEWLFEPQVGTNHWGIGLGFEALVCGDDDLRFMIAGNYRFLTPAWETRSFDLTNNGPWSRYLGVQTLYGLPTAPATLALPGINYVTQQAYIQGRSELNLYARLAKQFRSSYFELSYNFFCLEGENIGAIKNINPGYGIYALTGPAGGAGGVTTSSKATIQQDIPPLDPLGSPVELTSNNFNKFSACAGTYASNMLAGRFEISRNNIVYGFGAAVESGLSSHALSTWSVWAKFEYVFDNISSSSNTDDSYSTIFDSYDNIRDIQQNNTFQLLEYQAEENLTTNNDAQTLSKMYVPYIEEHTDQVDQIDQVDQVEDEDITWDNMEIELTEDDDDNFELDNVDVDTQETLNLDDAIHQEKAAELQELFKKALEKEHNTTQEIDSEDLSHPTEQNITLTSLTQEHLADQKQPAHEANNTHIQDHTITIEKATNQEGLSLPFTTPEIHSISSSSEKPHDEIVSGKSIVLDKDEILRKLNPRI